MMPLVMSQAPTARIAGYVHVIERSERPVVACQYPEADLFVFAGCDNARRISGRMLHDGCGHVRACWGM